MCNRHQLSTDRLVQGGKGDATRMFAISYPIQFVMSDLKSLCKEVKIDTIRHADNTYVHRVREATSMSVLNGVPPTSQNVRS